MKYLKIKCIIFLNLTWITSAAFGASLTKDDSSNNKIIDLDERTGFLLLECDSMLKKIKRFSVIEGRRIRTYSINDQYDEMFVEINAVYSGYYEFIISVDRNNRCYSKTLMLRDDVVNNDNLFKEAVLSAVLELSLKDNNDTARNSSKAYRNVFSFGYCRTSDSGKFYPEYPYGELHLSWGFEYDPSSEIYLPEIKLNVADYTRFNIYLDWATEIRENYFNIDILLFGKNKYSGTKDNGTRYLYGFFNGLEYFRPGFSDNTMKWDRQMNHAQPHIQYLTWRALEWDMMFTRNSGSASYSADFMIGAGASIGPSSLFYSGLSEEESENISCSFRSIGYRKQNYYYSYTLPLRITLSADHVKNFRFEFGYNYYFFFPIIYDNLFDMLHIFKGSAGYYLTPQIMLNAQYEHWLIESMLHSRYKYHNWDRLVLECKYYF